MAVDAPHRSQRRSRFSALTSAFPVGELHAGQIRWNAVGTPERLGALTARLAARGAAFVDAPVTGGEPPLGYFFGPTTEHR